MPRADAQALVDVRVVTSGVPAAIQSAEKLRKAQERQFRAAVKGAEQANKAAKDYADTVRRNTDAEVRALRASIKAQKDVRNILQTRVAGLERMEKALELLKVKESTLTGAQKKSAREGINRLNAQIKKREELIKSQRAQIHGEKAAVATAVFEGQRRQEKEEKAKKRKELVEFMTYDWKDSGKDIAEGFKESISALSSRDLKGMATGLLKGLGAGFKGMGAGLQRYSLRKAEDPSATGAGKMMGKAAGAIGGVVQVLTKLGPIMSVVGGLIMAIVKLFMDAEAAAKEFNKEILAGASTFEGLYDAGMDADAAMSKLDNTLTKIRKAAVDVQAGMDWGISKKQHAEFLGTLTAEGVSIRKIEKDAETAKKDVGEFSAEMVHVGVAYSRMFGVSLNEIATFQAEMFRDMGASQETAAQSFKMIARGAAESGIASNKFFAIIRGMSADMSLFNLRMEEAVQLLKTLGKTMSPRNAEKFMQTITQFYKGQGLQERIGTTLKAGGQKKVGGILQKGLTARVVGMSNDVAAKIGDPAAAQELQDAVKAGPAQVSKFMAKYQDKLDGSTREAILDATLQQGKLTKGGLVDVASALKDASPTETMAMWESISQQFFGKPIAELTDVERLAFEKLSGVTDEMQDQAIKAQFGLKQTKEDLAQKLETGGKLTQEQSDMVAGMNLQGSNAEKAAKVRAMSEEQIWGTMTELQKKQAMGQDDVKDYAKAQGQALDTIADKLERILDALMEYVYSELSFIGEVITKIIRFISLGKAGPSEAELTERKIRGAAAKSSDPHVRKAMKEAGKDARQFGGKLMASDVWQENVAGLLSAKTEKGSKGYGIQKDFLFKQLQKGFSGPELGKAIASQGLGKALEEAGLGKEMTVTDEKGQHQEFWLGEGVGPSDIINALEARGTSMDEMGQLVQDMYGKMGQIKLANLAGDVMSDATTAMEQFNAVAEESAPVAAPGAFSPTSPEVYGEATGPGMTMAPEEEMPADVADYYAGGTSQPMEETAENTDAMQTTMTDMAATTADTNDALQSQSTVYFKFPLPYLNGAYSKAVRDAVEEGVLPSIRKALFEYFMYSGMDPVEVAKGLKEKRFDPSTFGEDVVKAATDKGEDYKASFEAAPAEANQAGGVVTGVAGGMAVVKRPAAGEGFASIGRGEAITPAGAGRGGAVTVKLELSQDLKKVIQAESANVVYLDKARSKYTG